MRLRDVNWVVIDTETTGVEEEDTIVEVAASRGGALFDQLVNPQRSIPATASAIHHLVDADVAGAPILEEVKSGLTRFVGDDGVLVAHNAPFDRGFLLFLPNRWLCTYRAARHAWPDAPAYGNQVLRYWLGIEVETDLPPHRAAADIAVTRGILDRLLGRYLELGGEDDLEAFLAWVDAPIEVTSMPFGKHYGVPLVEVPKDYVRWALRNIEDMDPDLRWSLGRL